MRAILFLLILICLVGLFLWITLSGALLVIGFAFLLFFIIVSVSYNDTAILFFLGAREIKSADEPTFYAASSQEAYKLAVTQPCLYYYNGFLERAFVLQNGKTVSLILSKKLLEICTREELAAISFELLVQVKRNLAPKRTKVMFLIGLGSWVSNGLVNILIRLVPYKEFRQTMSLLFLYLTQPWLELVFKFTLGDKYFRKLASVLEEYPLENSILLKVNLKLRKPEEVYSLISRKMIELSSVDKSRHFQNIVTLEFLPHEWDLVFDPKPGESV